MKLRINLFADGKLAVDHFTDQYLNYESGHR